MSPFRVMENQIERRPIRMHHAGAIAGAMKAVNDHKTGIPEFMKNSAGAYHRSQIRITTARSRANRVITLLFRSPKGRRGGAIGCLDLVGMTQEDIRLFEHWFDPTASVRGDSSGELWGGHGNGAKSYMLNMFRQSWFATVRDDYFTRSGWAGADSSLQIGYIPSKTESGHVRVSNSLDLLNDILQTYFGSDFQTLPDRVKRILRRRPSWSIFVGVGAKTWANPDRLLEQLQSNPQAVRTIDYCSVYAINDGVPLLAGETLTLQSIPPLPGGEEPFEVSVPTYLRDPEGDEIDTTLGGTYSPGKLVLLTSRDTMLYHLRPRHIITCESMTKGTVGLYPVQELVSREADHIYGTLHLEAIREYESNFRTRPHDSPLTRAAEDWLRQQIINYANRFREQAESRHVDQEMNELRELNDSLNRFLQNFLDESETEENGASGNTQTMTGSGRSPLPDGQVARIEHNLGDGVNQCGENVVVYVRLLFFDSEGNRVKPVPVHWESSDLNIAYVQLGSIITGNPGECQIWAIAEGGLRSMPVNVHVLAIDSIEIAEFVDILPVGRKEHLTYEVRCDGNIYNNIKLDWHSNNEEFVKVGSNTGVITATSGPGLSEIWASARGVESNKVQINTSGEGLDGRDHRYPRVLLSEVDDDPDTGSPRRLDAEAGTIVQDIADRRRNIYWVNMRSPLAEPFYSEREGLGYHSPEFMMYLAERYAEVVFRDRLGFGDNQYEPADIEELMRERPTHLRQALARNLPAFLRGEWRP